MDSKKNDLGNRLLAQQVTHPEKRAHYQKEVQAMLEKMRQETWWIGLAHASIVVLFTVALFFGASILCYFTFQVVFYRDLLSFLLLALGWFLFFLAALALLWHLNRRTRMNDVLLQVKGLEMRLLELEESQRSGDERNRG
jgi:hypothetical protein